MRRFLGHSDFWIFRLRRGDYHRWLNTSHTGVNWHNLDVRFSDLAWALRPEARRHGLLRDAGASANAKRAGGSVGGGGSGMTESPEESSASWRPGTKGTRAEYIGKARVSSMELTWVPRVELAAKTATVRSGSVLRTAARRSSGRFQNDALQRPMVAAR